MANLPIVSNPQPAANTAGTSQKNGAADSTKPAESFGAVLARQVDEANAPSQNAPAAAATGNDAKADAKAKAIINSIGSKIKAKQDQALAAADQTALNNAPIDPSSLLAAMLQLPPEIKPPVIKDAMNDTVVGNAAEARPTGTRKTADEQATPGTSNGPSGAPVAMLQPVQDIKTTFSKEAASDAPATRPTGLGKAAENTLPAALGATQAAAQSNVTSATPGKADVAFMAADKLALRTEINVEQSKPAELPSSLTNATPLAHSAASGIMANMQTNKPADNPQVIAAPMGSKGWSDEFSQKISWMSTQQNQVAELHLNPPELGPLDVMLKISDSQATAVFTSPHSAVRDAIENALPKLRELLADNGIMLGNTTVSDQTPRDGSAFTNQRDNPSANRGTSGVENEAADTSIASIPLTPARRHNGMVDTFA